MDFKLRGIKCHRFMKGGSGLNNIHLEVGKDKYYYDNKTGEFLTNAGKRLPKSLRKNEIIKKALKKALDKIIGGW